MFYSGLFTWATADDYEKEKIWRSKIVVFKRLCNYGIMTILLRQILTSY